MTIVIVYTSIWKYSHEMHYNSHNIWKNCIIMLYILQKILHSYCLIGTKDNDDDFLIPECFFHDFRLVELLKLKRTLTYYDDDTTCLIPSAMCMESDENYSKNATAKSGINAETLEFSNTPAAMALKAEARGLPTSVDYHSWQHIEEDQKPSKLQTLFQITITALAFLSFGGYLLCLIVQTIKSKGTTYFHPVATAATTTSNNGVRRIKVYRRSRRYANNPPSLPPSVVYANANFSFFSNSNAAAAKEFQEDDGDMNLVLPTSTEMYNTLLQFAEGYVRTLE